MIAVSSFDSYRVIQSSLNHLKIYIFKCRGALKTGVKCRDPVGPMTSAAGGLPLGNALGLRSRQKPDPSAENSNKQAGLVMQIGLGSTPQPSRPPFAPEWDVTLNHVYIRRG